MAQIIATTSYLKDIIGLGANQAGTDSANAIITKDSIIVPIWSN